LVPPPRRARVRGARRLVDRRRDHRVAPSRRQPGRGDRREPDRRALDAGACGGGAARTRAPDVAGPRGRRPADAPLTMRLLVTGAAGFIGTNLVRQTLARPGAVERLVAVDLLTYAGNYANLAELDRDARFRFVRADIADRDAMAALVREEAIDAVVNCAAETHVDRSIAD